MGKVNSVLKSWITFVKKVQKEENITYPEAMKRAKVRKSEWKRGGATDEEDTSSSSPMTGTESTSSSSPMTMTMMGGKRGKKSKKTKKSKKSKKSRKTRKTRKSRSRK